MEMVSLTSAQLKEAAQLKETIENAQARLAEVLGGAPVTGTPAGGNDAPRKRTMPPSARKKIAEAAKARWAKYHEAQDAAAKAAAAATGKAVTPAAVPAAA